VAVREDGRVTQRDSRILFVAGLGLLLFGLLAAPWGFLTLNSLRDLVESQEALENHAMETGQSIPDVPLVNWRESIVRLQAIGLGIVFSGLAVLAIGGVLLLTFGRSALQTHAPRSLS